VAGADIERGRALMAQYQCGRCHRAADVPGADGAAAPPLDDFGRRSYVAGTLPNLPGPLQRYLLDPAAAVPGTTMPDLGLQPADARDIAGYLLHAR
jgi:cytochrome c2